MYSITNRVRFSEVDSEARLSPEGIVNYLQDCSIFHTIDSGLGLQYLKDINRVWILTSWQIVIEKYPKLGQIIKTNTNPYSHDRYFAYRNFAIIDESGEIMVKANSMWVYVDTLKNRPVRLKNEDLEPFYKHGVHDDELHMSYSPRKLKIPKKSKKYMPIEVKADHIDTNYHVNNCQYVRFAREYLPKGVVIKELRVEYKVAAKLNDIIFPEVSVEENRYFISMRNENGGLFAAVEFYI